MTTLRAPYRRVEVGQVVPDFVLRDVRGRRYSPRQYVGQPLQLVLLGVANPRRQLRFLDRLTKLGPVLDTYDVSVLLVVPPSRASIFSSTPRVSPEFPILTDPGGTVHEIYGALDWSGRPALSLFVADRWGQVFYRALTGFGERIPTTLALITMIQADAIAPSYPGLLSRQLLA